MASKIVGDAPCPACQSVGRDTTGNHMMLFEDGGKFCNRCMLTIDAKENILTPGKYEYGEELDVPSDTGDSSTVLPFRPGGTPKSTAKMSPVSNNIDPQSLGEQEFRKIPAAVRRKYGVTTETDLNGDPVRQFYPIYSEGSLLTHKVRKLPKDFYALDKTKGIPIELFGQHAFGGEKTLVITEGEEDAMAAYHMLKKYPVAVVSLPHGGNLSAITDNMKFLRKYKEIVLCPDQDEVGESVTKDIVKLLPDIRVMHMTEKDACDMLKESKQKEFVNDYFKAEEYKPASIVKSASVKKQALVAPEMGLTYPWEALTRLTYGARLRRIIGIGAGPGAGKTVFVKGIETHLIHAHKEKIGIFPLEETPGEAMREMAGYVMNKALDKPDTEYDEQELQDTLDAFDDKIMIYDSENYRGWGDIEEAIRYMASKDTRWFFIDPLSALTAHLCASDANEYLNEAMWRMSKLVKSLDISIFHVNHLNNPQGGKDHGAGGKVYASQFTGSRAQWKYSTDIWGLERDQYSDDEEVRNTTNVVMLKYRKPSLPGHFGLEYDNSTGTVHETDAGVFSNIT